MIAMKSSGAPSVSHSFASPLLSGGVSHHPLQRIGLLPKSLLPNIGAASAPGFGKAPPVSHNIGSLGRSFSQVFLSRNSV